MRNKILGLLVGCCGAIALAGCSAQQTAGEAGCAGCDAGTCTAESCSGDSCCGSCGGEAKTECCGTCSGEGTSECCGSCGGDGHSHDHGDGDHSHG